MAHVVRVFTVLPATHAFINERYEPCLCLPSQTWSSFYRTGRMEGWVKSQLSHPCKSPCIQQLWFPTHKLRVRQTPSEWNMSGTGNKRCKPATMRCHGSMMNVRNECRATQLARRDSLNQCHAWPNDRRPSRLEYRSDVDRNSTQAQVHTPHTPDFKKKTVFSQLGPNVSLTLTLTLSPNINSKPCPNANPNDFTWRQVDSGLTDCQFTVKCVVVYSWQ